MEPKYVCNVCFGRQIWLDSLSISHPLVLFIQPRLVAKFLPLPPLIFILLLCALICIDVPRSI
jgi:hypothetical protein